MSDALYKQFFITGSMHSSRSSSSDFGGGRSYMRFPSWPTTESPIKRSTSQMSTKSADGVSSPLSAGSDTSKRKHDIVLLLAVA